LHDESLPLSLKAKSALRAVIRTVLKVFATMVITAIAVVLLLLPLAINAFYNIIVNECKYQKFQYKK